MKTEKLTLRLADSEKELLTSVGGWFAFQMLLPLMRELAMYLDGAGPQPQWIAEFPELKSEAAMERLRRRRRKAEVQNE